MDKKLTVPLESLKIWTTRRNFYFIFPLDQNIFSNTTLEDSVILYGVPKVQYKELFETKTVPDTNNINNIVVCDINYIRTVKMKKVTDTEMAYCINREFKNSNPESVMIVYQVSETPKNLQDLNTLIKNS